MANVPSIPTMRNPSLFLYGAGDARYEERPIPQIEKADDVIVRVSYTGVCGSDVHFWMHGGMKRTVSTEAPLVMGHEASGVVWQVGADVTTLQPGDQVAMEPGYPCRRCARCKAGRYNLCPEMTFAGWPPGGHGTLTKYFKLPADYCYKIPTTGKMLLGLDGAVLMEPLAVAVHTARQVGVSPGTQMVVFGAGTIGLLCAAVAKEFGATKIVLVDVNATKLAFAETFVGDDRVLSTYRSPPNRTAEQVAQEIVSLHDLNGGATPGSLEDGLAGADIVVDATGAQPCIQQGIFSLRTGGTYIQTGMGKRMVEFPISTMGERELTVKGCFRYGPGDYQLAMEMASQGKIPALKSLVTKVLPFEQATEAWETTKRGEGMKTLIEGVQD